MMSMLRTDKSRRIEERYHKVVEDILVQTPAQLSSVSREFTLTTQAEEWVVSGDRTMVRVRLGDHVMEITHELSPVFTDGDGRSGRARLLDKTQPGATLIEWEFDAGFVFPPHYHGESEIMVVIDGVWRILVDGSQSVLGPADSITVKPGAVHEGVCISHSRMLTIMIPELRLHQNG